MEAEPQSSTVPVLNITAHSAGTVCAPVIDGSTIHGPLTIVTVYGDKEALGSRLSHAEDFHDVPALTEEFLTSCKQSHKSNLVKNCKRLKESVSHPGTSGAQNEVLRYYTELFLTEGRGAEVNTEHEVRQIETSCWRQTEGETIIKCNDIFRPLPGQDKDIRTMLTTGVAGIGKTVSVQKFILDWAEEEANQDIAFIFPLPFRELNLMKDKMSLVDLLHFFFPLKTNFTLIESSGCKLMFIFDGLDECRLPLDFRNNHSLLDVTETASVDVILTNLIKGNLLPSALLWITSRPSAADLIPPEYVDRTTEIRGFGDPQKEEYFRKRIRDQTLAETIISHIKSSRSLYIMCHIPFFCWISAFVLKRILSEPGGGNIPKTLTQMFTHFLIFQIKQKAHKYSRKCHTDLQHTKQTILALGKLAFQQLEKGNLIFFEDDLRECGIETEEATVYSGMCTQIFREEFELHLGKVFSFVHLSVQEFLAALFAILTFMSDNGNVLLQQTTGLFGFLKKTRTSDFLNCAVDKAMQSQNGHLDLFLRFLLGLSMESNQTLLRGLLPHLESSSYNSEETVKYIKGKIRGNPSPEKFINLFHCLNELNDTSLVQEVQMFLHRGGDSCLSGAKLSPAQWSALVFVLLNSQTELDEFNLSRYDLSEECLLKLMPVVKASRKVMLCECNLTERSCAALSSALSSSNLWELNLSRNELPDSRVELLCPGLKNPYCKLQVLSLCSCSITEDGCAELIKALRSNPSHLRELNLNYNNPGAPGVKELSDLLKDPHCKLEKLQLEGCSLTEEGCAALFVSKALKKSHLKELNLSDNNPGASGVKELSDLLKNPHCKLENLQLSNCNLTEKHCDALAAALGPSLRKLNLSYNKLQDSGVKIVAAGLKKLQCKLEMLGLELCSLTHAGCAELFKALRSNPSHLRKLILNSNKPGASGVKGLSDLLKDPRCKLEELHLRCCDLTEESLSHLALALRSSSLRELDLSDNTLQESGVKLLCTGLKISHCRLEALMLQCCSITEEGCAALVKALRSNPSHLRELNLNYNEPGESGMKMLSDLLKDPRFKLEKLHMLESFKESELPQASGPLTGPAQSNELGDPKKEELPPLDMDLQRQLRDLQFSDPSQSNDLNLNFKKVGDSGMETLSAYLRRPHCKVEKLQLRWCNLTSLSCGTLALVLSLTSSRLKELNLSQNKLQDSGVELLCSGLGNPRCRLKILSLCGCRLTEKSCASLASALRSASSLRELHLSDNKLKDSGVELLAAGLEDPYCQLEILGLRHCKITEDGCAALTKALKSNPSHLKELNLSLNKIPESGVKQLTDLQKNPNCKLKHIEF